MLAPLEEGIEMTAEAAAEAASPLLQEAGSGIAASSTSAAMQTSEAAAVSAARTSAASEATEAVKSIMPESLEGTTTSAGGRTINYFGKAPKSLGEAAFKNAPAIIGASTVSGTTIFGVWKMNQTFNSIKSGLVKLGKGGAAEASHLQEAAVHLSDAARNQGKESVDNAELEFHHALEAVENTAGLSYAPAKKVVEISVAVIVAGGILYTTYKGYMFLNAK